MFLEKYLKPSSLLSSSPEMLCMYMCVCLCNALVRWYISSQKGALTALTYPVRFAFYQEGLFQKHCLTLIGKGKLRKTLLERYTSSFLSDIIFMYRKISCCVRGIFLSQTSWGNGIRNMMMSITWFTIWIIILITMLINMNKTADSFTTIGALFVSLNKIRFYGIPKIIISGATVMKCYRK